MPKHIPVEAGTRFAKLEVLNSEPIRKNVSARSIRQFYLCKCDCGTERYIRKEYLFNGKSASCGCVRKEQARRIGKNKRTERGYLNHLYGAMRKSARRRGLAFELTFEQYTTLAQQNCVYCGAAPSMRHNPTNSAVGILVPVNGIDREDNTKGYLIKNSVPCCPTCNWCKREFTAEEFISHAKRIAKHHEPK